MSPAVEESMHRITTIHPRSYNDAKAIGESFRDGVPVIVNLSDMQDGDAKRMVDFSAGLVFGLRGTIERVTSDRKSTRLNSSHVAISYAVFCLKTKKKPPLHIITERDCHRIYRMRERR